MSKTSREEKTPRIHILFRYADQEHRDLIRKCADHAGLSVNAWIRRVTLKEARREARQIVAAS